MEMQCIGIGLDEAAALREAALDAYRRKHGMLSSQEIRAIRKRMGLTQSALSRLLHLGREYNLALGIGPQCADCRDGFAAQDGSLHTRQHNYYPASRSMIRTV